MRFLERAANASQNENADDCIYASIAADTEFVFEAANTTDNNIMPNSDDLAPATIADNVYEVSVSAETTDNNNI
ncbi:hypothetical protein PC118_g18015 [Phytophthora cactorum]|uniref:Uncharacterized protein n=1 Tax=Phytophthora cactorum TaxID=29920 RepID=A0A8T1FBD0_9STRA|nr:hypothetical protein PC118_g18015 [Phytophthora cactorum]